MSTAIKGRGYICINAQVWPELGEPSLPQAWHKSLLLPEGYTVESVRRTTQDARGDVFYVFVQHQSIPTFGDYEPMPELIPYYRIDENKQPVLDRIEIMHWENGCWQKEKTLLNA